MTRFGKSYLGKHAIAPNADHSVKLGQWDSLKKVGLSEKKVGRSEKKVGRSEKSGTVCKKEVPQSVSTV